MKMTVTERFIEYVKIDTESMHDSELTPSTLKQFDLARLLEKQCLELGLSDVKADKFGYVYATLPKNTENISPIGFVAHMDTTPDCSGKNVNPRIINQYDGSDIMLNDRLTMRVSEFPALKNQIGSDLIVTDGTTLLGSDDKAGVAAIMSAAEYLKNHPEIKHGDIKIAFTPDEEVGRGTDNFDVQFFGADFAYTVDGGGLGGIEYETFNAAAAKITINGISVHPGTAKNIMVNSALFLPVLIESFPQEEIPAKTEGYEGFYHLSSIQAACEKTVVNYIIRDHSKPEFERRKEFVSKLVDKLNAVHGEYFTLSLSDSYYNMKEVLDKHQNVVELAKEAMKELGIMPKTSPIRGGTDGANLCFMGVPCPNIFTGGGNCHGPFEFLNIQTLEKSAELIVKIAALHAEKSV